ncbi:MAG: hypothetical protein IJ125_00820 [Atopobiaceae bacterium]|nr:hypothetical protein [Atopobiaceae bacterium]
MADTYSTQLNVRMDVQTKEQGDAGLASIGLTASEAVRSLWKLAASGTQGLMAIKKLLSQGHARSQGEDASLDDSPITEAKNLYVNALACCGLETSEILASPLSRSDKELLEQALLEKYVDEEFA